MEVILLVAVAQLVFAAVRWKAHHDAAALEGSMQRHPSSWVRCRECGRVVEDVEVHTLAMHPAPRGDTWV